MVWWFSSDQNMAAFKLNPLIYAPQYGGFCAWALTEGSLVASHTNWWIDSKKLYFFCSAGALNSWLQDIPKYVKMGDDQWLEWYGPPGDNSVGPLNIVL